MATNKKPRKPYRPRWNSDGVKLGTKPWKIAAAFAPLDSLLDDLERTGEVLTDEEDIPSFVAPGGEWVRIAPALNGLIEMFDTHQVRSRRVMPLDPLRALVAACDHSGMIDQTLINDVRATLRVLRAEAGAMHEQYAHDLSRNVSLRELLEKTSP